MAEFTKEMKQTHTILVPDMLPIHFKLIIDVFGYYGYKMELLKSANRVVVDEGLKNVHNDTCYPALLVVGQFLEALKSGRYDVNHTALLITQTGGGCRASNYIFLLRKALETEFPQVPVISLNFTGLESSSGFQVTLPILLRLLYAVLYGDLLMSLVNSTKPYEVEAGSTLCMLEKWQQKLAELMHSGQYRQTKKWYRAILADFCSIQKKDIHKPRVGIVGEIYVKYSPLANNHLEDLLVREGCEPVVPGLVNFCLYCLINTVNDGRLYGFKNLSVRLNNLVYHILYHKQCEQAKIMRQFERVNPPHDFEKLRKKADETIHQGVKMGEGWLIPAEMAMMAETGTENIVCAQPFGCLPNHIVAKGMSRVIKDRYPRANIVAIDYDPSASAVNQENRIKLMLANIPE